MSISRRKFLRDSFGSIVLISVGNSLQSFLPASFILPKKEDIKLRFATASDGHYGQPGTEYVADHNRMVDWLNKEKENRGLDFVVVNGDIIHDDPLYFPDVKASWDKLQTRYYVTHGNHDMTSEAAWQKLWGIPFDHAFETKDSGIIILNTADEKGKYIGPDTDKTKALLNNYRSKEKVFVFMHITPVKWTTHGIDRPDIIALFNAQKNLKAVFHGHDHDVDGMQEKEGKYYFWDGHVAGNWGTSYKGYRVVEVLKDGSTLIYQMNPLTGSKVNHHAMS
ncbi:MAG TPA: metallophosphoesterase [Chitinophagaceae bacterium]|nr:metallophosphoesterase [Chitinophagaceae bacterium]